MSSFCATFRTPILTADVNFENSSGSKHPNIYSLYCIVYIQYIHLISLLSLALYIGLNLHMQSVKTIISVFGHILFTSDLCIIPLQVTECRFLLKSAEASSMDG